MDGPPVDMHFSNIRATPAHLLRSVVIFIRCYIATIKYPTEKAPATVFSIHSKCHRRLKLQFSKGRRWVFNWSPWLFSYWFAAPGEPQAGIDVFMLKHTNTGVIFLLEYISIWCLILSVCVFAIVHLSPLRQSHWWRTPKHCWSYCGPDK